VQQFLAENYLRWDSLGEYFALVPAFEQVALKDGNKKAKVLADTLDAANGKILEFNRTPARKIGELDNRGSHFYLALYWAQALAAQKDDAELAGKFAPVAKLLETFEKTIVKDFAAQQGKPVDIGGYYVPNAELLKKWMRPVSVFNKIIDNLKAVADIES
jgi:isocitrate dehydrogenase